MNNNSSKDVELQNPELKEATANLKNNSNTGKLPVGQFNPFIESTDEKKPEVKND